jgi:hypothetical protein
MSRHSAELEVVFNDDGFSEPAELANTNMTEADAAEFLVAPLARAGVTVLDWCVLTTSEHNCRLAHGRPFDGKGQGRQIDADVGRVVSHYNAAPLDLLDIVIKHGHLNGLNVWGNLRLNHGSLNVDRLRECPGTMQPNGSRKDFRDMDFQAYLLDLCRDLLDKGVDGISLDFERKAPFFPEDAPQPERFGACRRFLQMARQLTDKALSARVSHDRAKGEPQGQDPLAWLQEGLLDVVVPATHNHDPDPLDWLPVPFIKAARISPRPCLVCPQIWPTADPWTGGRNRRHSPAVIRDRIHTLWAMGADGVCFFNFLRREILEVFS